MDVIREEMDALRTFIGKCEEEEEAKAQIGMLTQNIKRHAGKLHEPNMKMVINGTGTVLHTNLGRAPISKEHVERLAGIVSGYSSHFGEEDRMFMCRKSWMNRKQGHVERDILILKNCFAN